MEREQSPFDMSIYLEWEPLAFPGPNPIPEEDRFPRWQALYSKWRVDGTWLCSCYDAVLIASMGWSFFMQRKEYGRALSIAREWLSHPDVVEHEDEVDEVNLASMRSYEGGALAMLGEVAEAVRVWRTMLSLGTSMHVCNVRNMLHEALREQDIPGLSAFAAEVASLFPGCKRLAKKIAVATTNAEVVALLKQTYGKRPLQPKPPRY